MFVLDAKSDRIDGVIRGHLSGQTAPKKRRLPVEIRPIGTLWSRGSLDNDQEGGFCKWSGAVAHIRDILLALLMICLRGD